MPCDLPTTFNGSLSLLHSTHQCLVPAIPPSIAARGGGLCHVL
jgi:hypothetical protein